MPPAEGVLGLEPRAGERGMRPRGTRASEKRERWRRASQAPVTDAGHLREMDAWGVEGCERVEGAWVRVGCHI